MKTLLDYEPELTILGYTILEEDAKFICPLDASSRDLRYFMLREISRSGTYETMTAACQEAYCKIHELNTFDNAPNWEAFTSVDRLIVRPIRDGDKEDNLIIVFKPSVGVTSVL